MTDLDNTPALSRIGALLDTDRQLRAATPRQDVIDAARRDGLRLPEILRTLTRGYADRPALASRSVSVARDPQTGRTIRHYVPAFDTRSYGELWANVEAIAATWTHAEVPVQPGELVATIGFASADYLTIDLVAGYLGLVAVPLQHNAAATQLHAILTEAQPQVLTVSADYLDLAIESAHGIGSVRSVVIFDYDARLDDHRDALDRARTAFAGSTAVNTLPAIVARGRTLPVPPLYRDGDPGRLAMILYTSGSTGLPKGAMWTERMLCTLWTTDFFRTVGTPVIEVNFMPLNHLGGRIPLSAIFQSGGTNYFVPESDLSTLFDDYRLVAPTHLTLVPRVVDMLHQHYRSQLDRLLADGEPADAAEELAKHAIRDELLGGRVLGAFISTAPLAPDMRTFLESTLAIDILDGYGLTEVGGVTSNGVVLRPPVTDYKLIDVPELGYYTTDRPHPRGELLVRSQTATPGYYKRPDVTAEVFDSDGYYRTGDVMAEIAPDHLVYLDRRNNVIKLSQGEFVAVANLEATYAGASSVRQIFVYGNSEHASLLAVVVPTEEALQTYRNDRTALKDTLRTSLRDTAASAELPSYEIPVDFLIETEPFSEANGLLSGVGKLLRPKLKERYRTELEQLYTQIADARDDELQALRQTAPQRPVIDTVTQAAQALLGLSGSTPPPDSHFGDLGGDSLSGLTFANYLSDIFGVDVPVGVIISASSDLAGLADFIEAERTSQRARPTAARVHGTSATTNAATIDAADLTLDKFIDDITLQRAPDLSAPTGVVRTVLLTGANGYLGRFLTLEWLRRLAPDDGHLITLVRGTDPVAVRARLDRSFDDAEPALRDEFRALAGTHLEVIAGDIGEPRLGLEPGLWHRLARDVDLVVHPAALVNHRLPYAQLFGPNAVGTAEVIRLAITDRIKPVSYLSTIAVAMGVGHFIEDGDIRAVSPRRPVDDGYANGYANSKWAGEVLLREAHDLCGLPVSVFRSDMILAHRRFAREVNIPDQFTRLLISLLSTGVAPRSFYSGDSSRAHYTGLPVDFVAAAITAIGARGLDGFRSYDVMNPHDDGVSLDTFVDWLIEDGAPITRIDDYSTWLARFEASLRAMPETQRQRSLLPLLDAYRSPQDAVPGAYAPTSVFHEAVRAVKIPEQEDVPHLDRQLIRKYLSDLSSLNLVSRDVSAVRAP